MFCPTCGNQLPDKSTFCPTCGAMGASVIKVSVLIPYRKGEKWGYIDTKGKLVIPAVYEDEGLFSDGLAPVELDDKWGYIDTKGTMTEPAIYYNAWPFREGLA